MLRETRYARSEGVNIAYQVVGHGPIDLVLGLGWVSHLDYLWDEPRFARFVERLATFSRVILFDKRGTGLSDPVPPGELPTLEQRMDDIRAVLEAVGTRRAALFGISESAAMCALFAASCPECTSALITFNGYARRLRAPDYPWGPTLKERQAFYDQIDQKWGTAIELDTFLPGIADDVSRTWWKTFFRRGASPGAALALARMNTEIDIREILPAIRVPTLVLQRVNDATVEEGNGRYLADHIPNATYVELPGADHLPYVGDQEPILAAVEHFLTGASPTVEPDRVLATIMAAEIVGAAETAVTAGDRQWMELQSRYRTLVQEEVSRYRGRQITPTLDGTIAAFDGPARAVRCASSIRAGAGRLGLRTRAGIHTGEVAVAGTSLAGVAVYLTSRIATLASPGDIVVSGTVKDLVAGSGLDFDELGDRTIPGIPGEWRLFRLAGEQRTGAAPVPVPDPGTVPRDTAHLSRRERDVATLLALGLSNRQIADELVISVATVERHVANILAKLSYRSRTQVAAWAVEQGFLRSPATKQSSPE
jgi:pimeloyl-ACP methyl ester carboxylesterase/DNA-binding CsgD family transcriptional regulator